MIKFEQLPEYGVHAAIAFTHEHPEIEQDWYKNSNHLAFLTVKDEREL